MMTCVSWTVSMHPSLALLLKNCNDSTSWLRQPCLLLRECLSCSLARRCLRDKKGVHNSFESPDSINQLNWNNTIFYADAFNYYKKLIQLRKNHPAFRLGDAKKVRESLEFLPTQPCVVGYRLKNHAGGDTWEDIIVILNGNREAKTVQIPDGAYQVVCCDGVIDERGLGVMEGGCVEVDPQSALILVK